MIAALCGFAALLRSAGVAVGSAELIDAARALTRTDLSNRNDVRRALQLTIAGAAVHPERFDRLFDEWFSGHELKLADAIGETGDRGSPSVTLDAETVDAARIHTEDSLTIETGDQATEVDDAEAGTRGNRSPAVRPGENVPTPDDGISVAATGELAPAPPGESDEMVESSRDLAVVELPDAPPDAHLELARTALAEAIERRRHVEAVVSPRRVRALSQPLSIEEQALLRGYVRRLDRQLDGAPSWRPARSPSGAVDLRRTMRSAVTSGGIPVDLRHRGRRKSAPLLIVLVDLSMSVRGTARLVLHLVHLLRSMRGSLRAFGFVDSCVSIDHALRVADPADAIERVIGLVDVDANSNPGLALRQWWARSYHRVTADTHVLILGDGRCNGQDPAFDVIERLANRSASTTWVSPEPEGAWTLGRGEMAEYARRVDRALTVRSITDLEELVSR
ncbi:MAG: VWA domain-containing protein [Actinomycetota bacterium]